MRIVEWLWHPVPADRTLPVARFPDTKMSPGNVKALFQLVLVLVFSMANESDFIDWLQNRLPSHPRLRLGIGDDAAVLETAARERQVITVDLLTEGVHFRLEEAGARRVGHKALAVNLSDLAAMAARPVAAVAALCLPRNGGFHIAKELFEGMIPLADRYELALAGGDTNSWDGPLVISVTVVGDVTQRGPLRRDGARPGDHLLVTGSLGGSLLGRHLDVVPRVDEAIRLHEQYELHAGIDLSDGLALDLSRMADASGCGAVVELDDLPLSPEAEQLGKDDANPYSAIEHALKDGEDFELLLAVPASDADQMLADHPLEVSVTRIGQMVADPGLWQTTAAGPRQPLSATGFQHTLDPS